MATDREGGRGGTGIYRRPDDQVDPLVVAANLAAAPSGYEDINGTRYVWHTRSLLLPGSEASIPTAGRFERDGKIYVPESAWVSAHPRTENFFDRFGVALATAALGGIVAAHAAAGSAAAAPASSPVSAGAPTFTEAAAIQKSALPLLSEASTFPTAIELVGPAQPFSEAALMQSAGFTGVGSPGFLGPLSSFAPAAAFAPTVVRPPAPSFGDIATSTAGAIKSAVGAAGALTALSGLTGGGSGPGVVTPGALGQTLAAAPGGYQAPSAEDWAAAHKSAAISAGVVLTSAIVLAGSAYILMRKKGKK